VSRFLTAQSAQLGYTVPIMLFHARKYRTEDKLKIEKLNTTQKKHTTQNTTKYNYPGSVAFYDTRPGNEVGLFYNVPELHGPHLIEFNFNLQLVLN